MAKKLKIEATKKYSKLNLSGKESDISDSPILKGAHTEIFGNNRINIEGCLGVSEYNDTYIKLRLTKGTLILCGNGFDIVFFENRLIMIKGKISSVEFCV